jgi:uncharacterized membrane protein YfcA
LQGRRVDESWLLFFFVGLLAQLVDGALGMAFGVTATTVMLSFGTAPAQASAMVHIAEIFTTAASGASHWWHRNVDWTIVRRIAIPGTIGGILGATLLSNVDGKVIAPVVTVYLALMGVLILARAIRKFTTVVPTQRGMLVVGFSGGVLDAVGGGGWGPIVTSTLVGAGHVPRGRSDRWLPWNSPLDFWALRAGAQHSSSPFFLVPRVSCNPPLNRVK